MIKNNTVNNESPARNIIGNGTIIKGEIESNGDIRIDGTFIYYNGHVWECLNY